VAGTSAAHDTAMTGDQPMHADEATHPPRVGGARVESSTPKAVESTRNAVDSSTPQSADRSTLVVAIDGPSGSGKSTVARGVARALGLRYLDTGAIYRALTWAVQAAGVTADDVAAVIEVADDLDVQVSTDPDVTAVFANGVDVAVAIRSDEVTRSVSAVSALPPVRQRMVALQRGLIGHGGIVVEGRDIGTVVCPDAPVKVFLTASPDARAARRSAESNDARGNSATAIDRVREELARRDGLDAGRVVSPLAQAADALPVDSTAMDVDAVVAYVLGVVAERTHIFASANALNQIEGEQS
jgi:cytidylate kinase